MSEDRAAAPHGGEQGGCCPDGEPGRKVDQPLCRGHSHGWLKLLRECKEDLRAHVVTTRRLHAAHVSSPLRRTLALSELHEHTHGKGFLELGSLCAALDDRLSVKS